MVNVLVLSAHWWVMRNLGRACISGQGGKQSQTQFAISGIVHLHLHHCICWYIRPKPGCTLNLALLLKSIRLSKLKSAKDSGSLFPEGRWRAPLQHLSLNMNYRRHRALFSFCLDANQLHNCFVDRTASLCDVVAIPRVRRSEQLISSQARYLSRGTRLAGFLR